MGCQGGDRNSGRRSSWGLALHLDRRRGAADGSLGERTALVAHTTSSPGPGQDGPHAHQIVTAPDGGHVLAVDLGNDTVYTYRLDLRRGALHQVSYALLRPGAGPRHLAFHPGGRFAFLACEVDRADGGLRRTGTTRSPLRRPSACCRSGPGAADPDAKPRWSVRVGAEPRAPGCGEHMMEAQCA